MGASASASAIAIGGISEQIADPSMNKFIFKSKIRGTLLPRVFPEALRAPASRRVVSDSDVRTSSSGDILAG